MNISIKPKVVISTLFIVVILSGCVSAGKVKKNTSEDILLKTGNSGRLIEYYKSKLQESDDDATRYRLIKSYIDNHDFDSAEFHLSKIKVPSDDLYFFYSSQVAYNIGKLNEAFNFSQNISKGFDRRAELFNLQGIILYELGEIEESNKRFELSRSNFVDDKVYKNNQAVLMLMNGEYQRCINLLERLYNENKGDDTVKSNLAICYAKNNDLVKFKNLYKGSLSADDTLRSYNYILSAKTK